MLSSNEKQQHVKELEVFKKRKFVYPFWHNPRKYKEIAYENSSKLLENNCEDEVVNIHSDYGIILDKQLLFNKICMIPLAVAVYLTGSNTDLGGFICAVLCPLIYMMFDYRIESIKNILDGIKQGIEVYENDKRIQSIIKNDK